MINKYKNISIIYGGSGREMATCISRNIEEMHLDRCLPIRSYILADEVLPAASILARVREVIASSSACVVILTFDDADGTRVRQNVLIEIGIALSQISEELCFFLCERETLPDDFPSDIKGIVNPYPFSRQSIQEEARKVCDRICDYLAIESYRGILKDSTFTYDYKRILDDIPAGIFEEASNIQMEHILGEWERNIESFDFVSEKIMYLAERLKFFPDFNNDEVMFSFLTSVESMIAPSQRDYQNYDVAFINQICRLVKQIIVYSRIKLDRSTIKHLGDLRTYRRECRQHYFEFKEIGDELREIIGLFEQGGPFDCNWLLKVMAYEYCGLAYMKAIVANGVYDDSILETLDYVEKCYENVIGIGDAYDATSYMLWRGYAQFDLTRLYETRYKVTGDPACINKMMDYSMRSIVTRKKWFTSNTFKGVFSSALSFEYFLVGRYEYELRNRYEDYTDDTPSQILEGLGQLQDELDDYCNNSELGRLLSMRESIERLRGRIAVESEDADA